MFEGSLVESCGLLVSRTQRWTALSSMLLQCGVVALLVTIPLVHPEMLPMLMETPRLALPIPIPKPPTPPVRVQQAAASSNRAMSLPAATSAPAMAQRIFMSRPDLITDSYVPSAVTNMRMGSGGRGIPAGLGMGLGDGSTGPRVSVAPAKSLGPLKVSSGVSVGMLLAPIQPVYPAIARAARVEGTVVMEALISKTGRIESLHALSGPEMLRGAALDAVGAARYQPYRLNGEATEVQTTITVVFRLGS